MGDRQYHLKLGGPSVDAAASVDAYLEYKRIVGDDDGGVMFTPEQYEDYKKRVLPQRAANRLYTSWTNAEGMDCKLVGPETPCFCQHRYKQHQTDFATLPPERPLSLRCKVKGCRCPSYHYVPLLGSSTIRCACKHPADEHAAAPPYQCRKPVCQTCAGFRSSYSCGCGQTFDRHATLVETREERGARGHPVGRGDVPYQAMGGLTGFSSLAEGYLRLDPSGRGAPSDEFLSQEITAADDPFLRAAVPSIQAHRKEQKDYARLDEDQAERMSAMRRPNESDTDYFERRYQERLKAEKAAKRGVALPSQSTATGQRKAHPPSSSRGVLQASKPTTTTEAKKK